MSQFIEMYYNTHNKQTLESVCPIMSKGITPKYVESSSVLVINQACIHWDGQRLGNIKYHNEEIPVRKRILESGDVLLNATGNGTLGRCCVFICPSDNNTCINDGHVIALSTDRAVILPEVLNTYLSLNDTQAEIYRQYVTGSTNQVDIVFSDIKKMKVPVPSMDEQILFVEVLKQADKSKFGDFKSQFIEMFGTVENNTHNFPIMTIGEFANCFAGATPSTSHPEYWENGRIRWMSSGEVHKGHVEDTDFRITELGYKSASTRMVPIHSIVIAIAGQGKTRGTVAITEVDLCTNQSLCAIVPDERVNYLYLYHNLQGRYLELRGLSGDVNGRGGLNLKIIQKIPVILPPIEKQQQFASIAQQADKSKSVIQKALVYLNDIQSDELGKIA